MTHVCRMDSGAYHSDPKPPVQLKLALLLNTANAGVIRSVSTPQAQVWFLDYSVEALMPVVVNRVSIRIGPWAKPVSILHVTQGVDIVVIWDKKL